MRYAASNADELILVTFTRHGMRFVKVITV